MKISSPDFSGRNAYNRPRDFETSLLVLSSVIIKADGVINKIELDFVRNYFVKVYGKDKANKAFKEFKNVIPQQVSVIQICAQIRGFMPYQARVQLIKFLFDVANSDGAVSNSEELEIRKIASYMMINQSDYIRLRMLYYRKNQQERSYSSTYSDKSDYEYEVLGLEDNATNDEVKKEYRKLVKKYHPDRLHDATKQDVLIAKQKFQKIQNAYEKIKNQRGF